MIRHKASFPCRVALLAVLALTVSTNAAAADKPLLVFAAASLKNAVDGVAAAFDKTHPAADIKVSYAGSSTLARQIEAGAPADVYMSADRQWMDRLQQDHLIDAASRVDLLGNTLVLIAPKDSRVQVRLRRAADWRRALGSGGYLAMANTDAVPAGIYGRQALTHLGVWQQLQGRIAQADDVRAALHLVDVGQSPLGVVYASDAVADKANVRVVDTFAPESHARIIYPAARIADSQNPLDAAFLRFMQTPKAARIFRRWGFQVLASNA